MEHLQQLELARQVVLDKLSGFGADTENGCSETILVRDSLYCGRRFGCGGWRAVWFVEERIVKFFDPSGRFIESLDLAKEQVPAANITERAA